MNSLNIISSRVSSPPSPSSSRSNSISTLGLAVSSGHDGREHPLPGMSSGETRAGTSILSGSEKDAAFALSAEPVDFEYGLDGQPRDTGANADETTPLLANGTQKMKGMRTRSPTWHLWPKRMASSLINSIRWVLSTFAAPGVYLFACLCDETGTFTPLGQLRKLFGGYGGNVQKMAADYQEKDALNEQEGRRSGSKSARGAAVLAARALGSSGSSSSSLSSESESDADRTSQEERRGSRSRHLRAASLNDSDEISPARRSIRIKLHNEESLRQRRHKKAQSTGGKRGAGREGGSGDIAAQLKSPTSPISALTKYPKTPAPPRPLIPRRQPSYINVEASGYTHQKTLILDLDETLIHSLSKGGRMSTGHMVEVRLNTTYVGAGGQATLGPQHPILYYVHKRPHCDDFLRRVCKWFNLVVFTASVQEYADPVIDWLEADRKYFSGRYYRQHCTFRHGAFIKDLSAVEPDLSKVMILDNSPLSYMFHQDNAIPIQGWINDPTDHELLNLVPLLEGLQYVSDVRALLALRGGEEGQHMA